MLIWTRFRTRPGHRSLRTTRKTGAPTFSNKEIKKIDHGWMQLLRMLRFFFFQLVKLLAEHS